MTTNKPEVKRYFVDCNLLHFGDFARDECDTQVVRLSDYEALQAECDKLRKDAERFRTMRERLAGPTFDKHFFLELYNVGAFDHPDDVDDSVDDATQEQPK